MTKAPFSVEWLSQSSQGTCEPRGFLTQLGNPVCTSRTNPPPHQNVAQPSQRGKESERIKALETSYGKDSRSETRLDSASSIAPPAAEPGSERESGRSQCQCPEGPGGRASRRLRTAFSAEQIGALESSFQRHKYLGAAERRKLAAKMRLSEVQIKTWFQNRRMKLKRQLQETRPEPFYSPVPYGARAGTRPLRYVCPAQQQLLAPLPRQEPAHASFAFPALPASALGSASTCRGDPGDFWQAPCFVSYADPRAFLLPI